MDAIANMVLQVEDGELRIYRGNYNDYLWEKEREAESAGEPAASTTRRGGEDRSHGTGVLRTPATRRDASARAGVPVRGGPKSREQKRREAEARKKRSSGKKPAREERRRVQEEIAAAEQRLEEIEIALLDPSIYADGERVKPLVNEQRTLKSLVDELYERWAELED